MPVAELVERQPHGAAGDMDSSLHTLLTQLRLSELRGMVEQRGWSIKGGSKADLATAIAPLLTDHTEVARAVVTLPKHLRQILSAAFVAEAGSGITPAALAQVATALGGAGSAELKPVEAAGYLNDLARWGLLIPWRNASFELRFLFPTEIQRRVPPLPGCCVGSIQIPSANLSPAQRGSFVQLLLRVAERFSHRAPKLRPLPEPPLDRRLQSALGDWTYDPQQIREWAAKPETRSDRGPRSFRVTPKPFLLDDTELEALVTLTGGNLEKAEFVCRMLQQLGIVASSKGHLVVRRRNLAALQDSPSAQRQTLLAYFSLLDWSELDWLLRTDPELHVQRNTYFPFSYHQFRSFLLLLRNTLSRFLAVAATEAWHSLADMGCAVRTLWPTFFLSPPSDDQDWRAHAHGLAWEPVRRPEQNGRSLDGEVTWESAQGAFLRLMLQGPLHWLGLADTASPAGSSLAFRLFGLSDLVWGRADTALPSFHGTEMITLDRTTGSVIVDPRLAPPQIHAFLGSIAYLEDASAARFTYRLDMRKACATFATTTLEELLVDWQAWMPLAAPPPLLEKLNAWWSDFGHVHLYDDLALLEVEDAVTLRELEATTSLPRHTLARLSPNTVVVPDSAVGALLQEFTTKGYTPKEVR